MKNYRPEKPTEVFAQRILNRMGLSEQATQMAARYCRVVSLDASEVIYSAGKKVHYWDFVISGAVGASLVKSPQQSSLVLFYSEGAWFGDHHIINRELATFEYSALTAVEILRLPEEKFMNLIKQEPEFAQNILKRATRIHQRHLDHLTLLKHGASASRVFYGLAMCLEYFLQAYSLPQDSTESKLPQSLMIPLKQELLAQFCGVSRTVMSRDLQRLSLLGLVRTDYSEIELIQLHVWLEVLNDMNHQLHNINNLTDPIDQMAMKNNFA